MRSILVVWVVARSRATLEFPFLVQPDNNAGDGPLPLAVEAAAALGSGTRLVDLARRGWALEVAKAGPWGCHMPRVLSCTLGGDVTYK